MLIDWFTTAAQIINFVILILLLRRFLYQPFLSMMAERDKKNADELAKAAAEKEEAARQKAEFEERNRQLREQEKNMLKQAREEAEKYYRSSLEELRNEIQIKRMQWYQKLEKDKETFLSELETKAQDELLLSINRLLVDLADVNLESQIFNVFIRKLREIPDEKINEIVSNFRGSKLELTVTSGYSLPTEKQELLSEILRQLFTADALIYYKINPEIIGGMELSVGDQKIFWSIEYYLRTLRKNVEQVLEMRGKNGKEE